ncbi:hypothetical protein TNCV_2574321 [Trichonephila clavipes]|nr:hypothetical protein TNCV_2574321 [Trichonephila clavipes]
MERRYGSQDDNAPCHRTVAAEQLLESEDIERMDWPERSPDLQFHRACMVFSRQTLGSSVTIRRRISNASTTH